MRVGRMVYWFVTGACLGLGLDIWALGIFFLAGVMLLLIGVFARPGREAVVTALGLGLGTAAILALVTFYTDFQGGPPVALVLYGGLVISILSTVIGLVALAVVWRTPQRGAGPTAS